MAIQRFRLATGGFQANGLVDREYVPVRGLWRGGSFKPWVSDATEAVFARILWLIDRTRDITLRKRTRDSYLIDRSRTMNVIDRSRTLEVEDRTRDVVL